MAGNQATNQPILDKWPIARWCLHVQGFESFQSSVTRENCPSGCQAFCLDFHGREMSEWKLEIRMYVCNIYIYSMYYVYIIYYIYIYVHILYIISTYMYINHWGVYINHVLHLISQHLFLETKKKHLESSKFTQKSLITVWDPSTGTLLSPDVRPCQGTTCRCQSQIRCTWSVE